MNLSTPRELSGRLDTARRGGGPIALWYLVGKWVADKAVAGLLLFVLSPLIVILMVLVKLTSRGPAIYQQLRSGLDGRPFPIYKLRSMRKDCEKLTGPQWASVNGDPRVTRLGHFLRATHLDELPQLWNVLRGDMSLVGPRPERPEFVAKLERVIPGYRERMSVLPGITGLAQIQLPPDESVDDVRRKVRCDLCYINSMTARLDAKIVIGTVLKISGVPLARIGRLLALPGASEIRYPGEFDRGPSLNLDTMPANSSPSLSR